MTLRDYIQLHGIRASAELLGLSYHAVVSYSCGRRRPTWLRALDIERRTDGVVAAEKCGVAPDVR